MFDLKKAQRIFIAVGYTNLRQGMRYDFGFEFEYADNIKLDLGEQPDADEQNDNWPTENINRFWFVQIQALGKLYRKDYLISSYLANMNCNETLVMQMVLRDLKYGTNRHRYGYAKEHSIYARRVKVCIITGQHAIIPCNSKPAGQKGSIS